MTAVPEGFAPHFRQSPVTDPWEPLYSRQHEVVLQIGLVIAPPHSNSRGMLHGGVIAAIADNAMGLSCALSMKSPSGLVTITLALDYVGAGKLGQWLQVSPRVIRAGKSMGFVDALITADDAVIARASATFRALD
jgi:uncharacterized protein (TIGR00369 family)